MPNVRRRSGEMSTPYNMDFKNAATSRKNAPSQAKKIPNATGAGPMAKGIGDIKNAVNCPRGS